MRELCAQLTRMFGHSLVDVLSSSSGAVEFSTKPLFYGLGDCADENAELRLVTSDEGAGNIKIIVVSSLSHTICGHAATARHLLDLVAMAVGHSDAIALTDMGTMEVFNDGEHKVISWCSSLQTSQDNSNTCHSPCRHESFALRSLRKRGSLSRKGSGRRLDLGQ